MDYNKDEKELLKKLYECQEMMADLLDGGKEDKHYAMMAELIDRLEKYLVDGSNNVGI